LGVKRSAPSRRISFSEHPAPSSGPTWIYGSKNPTGGSPLGALSRRDAVLAMSRRSPARD
jgi:hypothetical protein